MHLICKGPLSFQTIADMSHVHFSSRPCVLAVFSTQCSTSVVCTIRHLLQMKQARTKTIFCDLLNTTGAATMLSHSTLIQLFSWFSADDQSQPFRFACSISMPLVNEASGYSCHGDMVHLVPNRRYGSAAFVISEGVNCNPLLMRENFSLAI